LIVFDIATQSSAKIYGEPNIASAAWSPDGTQILLSSDRSGQRVLMMLNPITRQLKDVRVERVSGDLGPQEALWSPDGKQIFLHSVTRVNSAATMALLTLDGAFLRIVDRRLDQEDIPLYWSVDGNWIIAVAAMVTPGPGNSVYEVYAEEVASLSNTKRMKIPDWQRFQKSIGASDLIYDQRYWPWKTRSAPITCPSRRYFAECP
jgi:dipeptidyl aminopeptidase/acylaminoacyl peptidase